MLDWPFLSVLLASVSISLAVMVEVVVEELVMVVEVLTVAIRAQSRMASTPRPKAAKLIDIYYFCVWMGLPGLTSTKNGLMCLLK